MSKNKVINILIIVGIILASGYLLTSFVLFSERKDVTCKGLVLLNSEKLQLVKENDIIRFLEKNNLNPQGKKIADIQTEKIERVLQKNPMIKNVECYSTPSGTINVRIEERTPKFRVMSSENYYVDHERQTMPVSTNYAAYVPVVSGRLTKTFASTELFDFIDFLENDSFWKAQIEQIHVFDNQSIELITRIGDATVILGNLTDYKKKMKKLHKLYAKAFNEIGWNRYKTIDLRYKDQIVCTKSDQLLVQESN